ncbi:MAG TPA: glycosyltransferase family A protein [Bacteroidales bacterium]|nr:glycosyltransferase family A protein [Bacteroidales bacterium]
MRISVIMPVCLDPYQTVPEPDTDQFVITSAPNAEYKFRRACDSFGNQNFRDAELIIVSDGNRRAEEIFKESYEYDPRFRFKYIEKQPSYSGKVRQTGLRMAKGDIICYLDHDDQIGKDHLTIINDNFDTEKYDWIYYDDYLVDGIIINVREVTPEICKIGTSSIAHRRDVNVKWGNKYGHDWYLIKKYLLPLENCIKILTPQYYVCHATDIIIL